MSGGEMIKLDAIRTDGGTQSRAKIDPAVVYDYVELINTGVELPPVVVFFDGATYWLADGFHRFHARLVADLPGIQADVRQGSQRDAILYSVGANARHGLRRTPDDKRRAVQTLLNDPEWSQWTQARIAEVCGVSRKLVNEVEGEKASCNRLQDSAPRTVERGGSTYTMKTNAIGRREAPAPAPMPEPQDDGAAPAPVESEPEPEAKVRREIARLTTEAMIDEIVGLRADLADSAAEVARLTLERDDLKAKWKEATSDDRGLAIRNLQRKLDTSNGRMKEHMTTAKRLEYRLNKSEARVKELEAMPVVPA